MAQLQKISLTPTVPPTTNPAATPTMNRTTPPTNSGSPIIARLLISLLIIALGVGTGYALANFTPLGQSGARVTSSTVPASGLKVGDIIGSSDEKTFKDSVEGYLDQGGMNGEGSHRLLRTGGDSQTVYLTSSVIDLDQFVGVKVKVWGETFKGQKVGWLMDVGRVQVQELNAAKPE